MRKFNTDLYEQQTVKDESDLASLVLSSEATIGEFLTEYAQSVINCNQDSIDYTDEVGFEKSDITKEFYEYLTKENELLQGLIDFYKQNGETRK